MKLVTTYPLERAELEQLYAMNVDVVQSKDEELWHCADIVHADILLANQRTLQPKLLSRCRELKWVQVTSVGIERLPMDMLEERLILVTNAWGVMGVAIAEDILCKMLMLSRKSRTSMELQRERIWRDPGGMVNLSGKTIGLLGTGDVGTAAAFRAKAFGMTVVGLNTSGRQIPPFDQVWPAEQVNELIAISDYIVLTLPLTSKTELLLNREQFALMKPSAYLINISRGALINEEVLLDYLQQGKIAGAALDVFVEEFALGKLPETSPFWDLDNVIITPHSAAGGDQRYQLFTADFLSNMTKFVHNRYNEMSNVVHSRRGY